MYIYNLYSTTVLGSRSLIRVVAVVTIDITGRGRQPILCLCLLPIVFDVVKESRLKEVLPAAIRVNTTARCYLVLMSLV
jgi:hypothetical protein